MECKNHSLEHGLNDVSMKKVYRLDRLLDGSIPTDAKVDMPIKKLSFEIKVRSYFQKEQGRSTSMEGREA